MYKLLKLFPGMDQPVGTIFCSYTGWARTLGTKGGQFSTEWNIDKYFEPFVGEFFEKL